LSRPFILGRNLFRDVLARECWRADRFNQPFTLIVVTLERGAHDVAPQRVVNALSRVKRETDILGWLEPGTMLGLILPEVAASRLGHGSAAAHDIRVGLEMELGAPSASYSIDTHCYGLPQHAAAAVFSPDALMFKPRRATRVRVVVKRALDIVLSAGLLVLVTPLLAVIALVIKLKSPGPILFRQERVGQSGKPFTMLKFRTMQVNSDSSIHQEFVSEYINGAKPHDGPTATEASFKIVDDPRVTSIGGILRRSSLDELPQLWNVLRGDMSLVGPRPPLRYEVERYKRWHYRPLLEVKPGITGLWQVTGRSRTTFDDKVRLDLRYAKYSSSWMDIKILLATPRAVLSGEGAR
jgi:lipopolysaccharide/colanic/teichoic acid biosynthesis glycosyltransferase